MKKLNLAVFMLLLCLLPVSCGSSREGLLFTPSVLDRTNAVVDIQNIERSTIEVTGNAEVTMPHYFEVVAASTTAVTSAPAVSDKEPIPTVPEKPTEYYMVKFVDYDGYSMISVQNVAEGSSAVEPPMPERRDNLIFRGWDKDFSAVNQSIIVKAIYQKEMLTVRFFDVDGTILKTQKVAYGEDATPPTLTPPSGYVHTGWMRPYTNITNDIDIYASYSASPVSNALTLVDAYKLLSVTKNTLNVPEDEYIRDVYTDICTVNGVEYTDNIVYGFFSDRFVVSDYDFKAFEGKLGMIIPDDSTASYTLNMHVFINGMLEETLTLNTPDTVQSFSVNLKTADTLTVRLEPFKDGAPYLEEEFIGGIIDAIIY